MRVLVLHSRLHADARPDDLDTLVTADAICAALRQYGHVVTRAAFVPHDMKMLLSACDLVFNLVESVEGCDELCAMAPVLFEGQGVSFTGATAAVMQFTGDKPATKRVLRALGLSTPDWCEGPKWQGLDPARCYIVKSATADASLGLDDGAVVMGDAVKRRALDCRRRLGGRWFAEAFVDGREFNVALLEGASNVQILPIAEMRFVDWDEQRPRIVGYGAKWDETDPAHAGTVRQFGCEADEADLATQLCEIARRCWDLFGIKGYGRIDLRVDRDGLPYILEINTNPCLSPDAGFAAAAKQAGYDYSQLIDLIARVAGP